MDNLTHSLCGFLGLGFRSAWLLLFACLGSHLLLDVLTNWGTQLLSPFSSVRLALDWVFIVDGPMLLILALGLALRRRQGAQWAFALLALYLGLAAGGHALAVRQIRRAARLEERVPSGGSAHPTRVEAIPAPLAPLFWNGLAVTADGQIPHYAVNLLRGGARLQPVSAPGLQDPLAQAFFHTQAGVRYLAWARVPRVRQFAPDLILLEDLRYDFPGLDKVARPGVLEVRRETNGSLTHRWLAHPPPEEPPAH